MTESSPVQGFVHPEDSPLRSAETVLPTLGRAVIVSPHPDDETLGCGGLIASLAGTGAGSFVHVVMVSDGAASHPGSRRFPAPARREMRERETLAALGVLGIADPAAAVTFLRLPDGAVPGGPSAAEFAPAAEAMRRALADLAPDTLFIPWRRDPHPDHRATYALAKHALAGPGPARRRPPPRIVEYPVWLWERAAESDAPSATEVSPWRLDIRGVLPRKLAAIAEHRSQTTDLIDDDPGGFRLSPSMLAHFHRPWELYLEAPASAG